MIYIFSAILKRVPSKNRSIDIKKRGAIYFLKINRSPFRGLLPQSRVDIFKQGVQQIADHGSPVGCDIAGRGHAR